MIWIDSDLLLMCKLNEGRQMHFFVKRQVADSVILCFFIKANIVKCVNKMVYSVFNVFSAAFSTLRIGKIAQW